MQTEMQRQLRDARESLYLLSIELLILYLAAFGLLALKTETMFAAGMAYPAVLFTLVLAYLLPALGLLFAALGANAVHNACMAGARGAAVFQVVAFLLLAVLVASLWSSPLVCVLDADATALCHVKGDSAPQRTASADVRFAFPSRAQYLEYAELANASVADVFLKTSLSENDYVTKLHAVVGLPFALVVLVVQSSFFYAVAGLDPDGGRGALQAVDVYSLFVRCALLLLCIVVDSADLFCYWNVTDVGPQMLPSLAFITLLVGSDMCDAMLAHAMQAWTPNVRVALCAAEAAVATLYTLFAALVTCHYAVGGLAFMQDFISDTRSTTVHILLVVFLLLDAGSALTGCLYKLSSQLPRKKSEALVATASQTPATGNESQSVGVIDFGKSNTKKKS